LALSSCDYICRYYFNNSVTFSSGVCIARAIALEPKFIVADEPISSLDKTTRNQILNLMRGLKKGYQLTYLFTSHDLTVIKAVSDRVAVMYLGKIVEISSVQIFERPPHPYTIVLLSSILPPRPEPKQQPRQTSETESVLPNTYISSSIDIPFGCRFHTSYPYAFDKCRYAEPQLEEINGGHFVACHLLEEN
jgi:oligopeptide/dipeptide ABC transporter ATP-binding protein